MFFSTFAWSFVFVSLPFHIQALSPGDAASTLRWTGWILGISPLVTVAMSPVWGYYAERGNPRALYAGVEVTQAVAFIGMALARTLPELFLSRVILGVVGAASTFAFIIAGRDASTTDLRRRISSVQAAMTVAQVIGPLAGVIIAARLGFRTSFVLGGLIILACAALVQWGVPATPPRPLTRRSGGGARPGEVIAVALLVLGGNVQIFFLPAILPEVLPGLGVEADQTLEMGGILIFVSGAAAALGALAAPRLAELGREGPMLAVLLTVSSALVAALALIGTVWPYGVLRFLQVLCIAPLFSILVARIAPYAGGQAIGVINSARIGAAFVGPVLATTVLAWTSPAWLYILLAAIGLACVPLIGRRAFGGRPV
jgi:MFS family permease